MKHSKGWMYQGHTTPASGPKLNRMQFGTIKVAGSGYALSKIARMGSLNQILTGHQLLELFQTFSHIALTDLALIPVIQFI